MSSFIYLRKLEKNAVVIGALKVRNVTTQTYERQQTRNTVFSSHGLENVDFFYTKYLIWHSTDVRAEWPPFSALPGIWLAPFFQQKVYEWPDFFWIPIWKAQCFWHPGICTYVSLRDFSRLLILLVLHELTVIFVLQPAKNRYKISKAVYE